MLPSVILLSLLLTAFKAVDASPVSRHTGKSTLTFSTRVNEHGTLNILERDRHRAYVMKQAGKRGKHSRVSVDVANAGIIYSTSVRVGSPAIYHELVIDTASSDVWLGASKSIDLTDSSRDTGNAISATCGWGSFSGEEWIDTVILAPNLVVTEQSIGVAHSSSGFWNNVDGIIGLGPVELTRGIVANMNTVPTVLNNLVSQGTIAEEVLGVYFAPASEKSSSGVLTFGGHDGSVINGPLAYFPLTTTSPASMYWGVDLSISYGKDTILPTTAGVFDTGSTLVLIATDSSILYQIKTGAVMDPGAGLLRITPEQYGRLQTLCFNIGSSTFDLVPNAQTWPRSLNSVLGSSSHAIYLVVGDLGTWSGDGLDFVNGYTFLERYYSVYDATNKRLGLASTKYTFAESN